MPETDLLALEGKTILLDLATCPPSCPSAIQHYTVLGFADAPDLKTNRVDAVTYWPDDKEWDGICARSRTHGRHHCGLPVNLSDTIVAIYLRPRAGGPASVVKLVFSISHGDHAAGSRFQLVCEHASLLNANEVTYTANPLTH